MTEYPISEVKQMPQYPHSSLPIQSICRVSEIFIPSSVSMSLSYLTVLLFLRACFFDPWNGSKQKSSCHRSAEVEEANNPCKVPIHSARTLLSV